VLRRELDDWQVPEVLVSGAARQSAEQRVVEQEVCMIKNK